MSEKHSELPCAQYPLKHSVEEEQNVLKYSKYFSLVQNILYTWGLQSAKMVHVYSIKETYNRISTGR